jgi:hypothetical protein
VSDVGRGVFHLIARQRPPEPVREPVRFGQLDAALRGEQVGERRGGVAEKAGRQLRVEKA